MGYREGDTGNGAGIPKNATENQDLGMGLGTGVGYRQ